MAEVDPNAVLDLLSKDKAPAPLPPAPSPLPAGGNPTDAGSQIKAQLEAKAAKAVAERQIVEDHLTKHADLEARLAKLEAAFEQSLSGFLGQKITEGLAKAEDRLGSVEHVVGHIVGFVVHGQHSRLAAIQSWLKRVFP